MATHTASRTPADADETARSAGTDETLPTLAEVLDRVVSDGPQIITRGEKRFIVLGAHDYTTTTSTTTAPKRAGLVDALLGGPRFDGVDIEHEPWDMRDVEL
ncbi:MAG: hypothetical protein WBA46_17465 [Thermomicrobiales bacterium]